MIDSQTVRRVKDLTLEKIMELADRQLRSETAEPDGGKRIAEIRARLEGATAGPWYRGKMVESIETGMQVCTIGPFEQDDHYEDTICEMLATEHDNEANGNFVANAFSDIEYLLGLLK
jgi:hypothetical protein